MTQAPVSPPPRDALPLSGPELVRYGRHLLMPEVGLDGQRRLKEARVLCVGTGGLGSPLTLYLAAAGVGHLGLVEFDTVDASNLQRQILYGSADVGRAKIDAACERLRAHNPEIVVTPHAVRLDADNALGIVSAYDVVADGTDNFPSRYLINDAAFFAKKPNVYASVFRFEGQLSVFDARTGPCYRCLFPTPPPAGLVPSCAEGGVLGVLPGILGAMQALEVIKIILGVGDPLIGRLLLLDALGTRLREWPLRKDPACPLCGEQPSIRSLQVESASCERPPEDDFARLTVEDLHGAMTRGETVHLIDVREPHELAIAAIPGALSYPLSALPTRLRELTPTQPYTISCHHGSRALRACALLREAGFRDLRILEGGVDAWATRIDPSLRRY